jgi:hypothetical protein
MIALTAVFQTNAEFLKVFDGEIARKGLLVRGATLERVSPGTACQVFVQVEGGAPIDVAAQVAAVVPNVGVAVLFTEVPAALTAFAAGLRAPPANESPEPVPGSGSASASGSGSDPQPEDGDDEVPRGSLFDRLKTMTVTEKTQLALSGTREERMALIRDSAKTIHIFVLKNPRLGLDEVQAAAKQASLSPDALKLIAEHREWGMNAAVCSALVRNPKTPIPVAVRLIERIPLADLKVLAKGGARDQIVLAARKKLNA